MFKTTNALILDFLTELPKSDNNLYLTQNEKCRGELMI